MQSSPVFRAAQILALALTCLLCAGCARRDTRPVLTFWIGNWNADTRALLDKKLVPEFERAHDVDVKVEYLAWSHLDEKLTITYAGGVQPDVFQVGAEYVGSMAYRGQAEKIDRYVKDWPQRTDYIPSAWSAVVAGGHVYGLPYSSAPRLLIYRKDLYRKAGLPDPPRTWEEWARSGRALTKRDARGTITRAGIYFSPVANWQYFVNFLWENGGDLLTPDGTRAVFNSPEGVEALTYLVDLFRKDKVCPPAGMSASETSPLFASGEAAQEITNPLLIRNVVRYARDFGVGDLAVALPPTRKKPAVAVYTSWLAMSSQSRHKDLAWEFMKFLSRPDNLIAYNETQYFVPPIHSARNSAYVRNTPFMPEFVRAMELYGRTLPPIPEWFEMRAGFHTAVDQSIYGDKSPKQALDDYALDVDKLLALRLGAETRGR